jgi:predicted aspartyl protease
MHSMTGSSPEHAAAAAKRRSRLAWLPFLAAAQPVWGTQAEVPLKWDSTGHVVVPTFVNGKGPYDFIFDTGADETGVYAWFARSLDLPKGKIGELSGATGSTTMTGSRIMSLSVDGYTIGGVEADTMPDRVDGARLAGVAGVDLMMGRLTLIDFGCSTAALLPIETPPAAVAGKDAVPVKAGAIRDGKQLTLPVTVSGVAGVAVLDSGARATIINRKFAAAAGIDPASPAFRDVEPTRGATMSAVSSRVGPIGTVAFAGLVRPQAVARVVDLPVFEGEGLATGPALNLGLDLLRGARLTIDYAARRFWLAQSSCRSSPAARASAP